MQHLSQDNVLAQEAEPEVESFDKLSEAEGEAESRQLDSAPGISLERRRQLARAALALHFDDETVIKSNSPLI